MRPVKQAGLQAEGHEGPDGVKLTLGPEATAGAEQLSQACVEPGESTTVVSSSEIKTTVPTGATTGYVEVATPNSGTLQSNVVFGVAP